MSTNRTLVVVNAIRFRRFSTSADLHFMSLTLLLDLDDTLLDSNIDVFIPAYFKKLAGFLAHRVEPGRLIDELLVGRNLMFENERPDLTLEDVFSRHFFPTLGMDAVELQPELDRFYDEIFPSLKEFSSPRPEAVAMVECAFDNGWRVVIATNPLFPRKTIEHRLRWANLPPEKYPFSLITSFETSHFSKAMPAYYHEVLGDLGWPSGPVVMVGDDPVMDVDSASKAGLPVFWIRPEGKSLPELAHFPQGAIRDFCNWIHAADFDPSTRPDGQSHRPGVSAGGQARLQPDLKTPTALLASLQAAPAVLDTLLRTLKPAEWTARPHKDEWALVEILCHMRDLDAEVNLPRIEALVSADNPFITGQDTDPWARERDYIRQDGAAAFRDFIATRMRLIEKLQGLSTEGWQRRGRHTIFGPTHLQELVGFMAEHDRTHVQQARTILGVIRKV